MTRKELLEMHVALCNLGRELMEAKSNDYSNGADPFHNFRMSALLHIPACKGVMLRMQDKMARLVSFIDRGDLKVKDESVTDTIIDLINYSVILNAMLKENRKVEAIIDEVQTR